MVASPLEDLALERTSLPPGPPLPRLVQSAAWLAEPARFMEWCHRAYGDAFTVRLAGVPPMVVLSDPAGVRDVLLGDPETFHVGDANVAIKPAMWLAAFGKHSLFLLDGRPHRDERKWMMTAFHPGQLRTYEQTMAGCVEKAVDGWAIGASFDLHRKMQELTLDVLLQTIFGKGRADPGTVLHRAVAEMLAFRDHASVLLLFGREAEDRLRRVAARLGWPAHWAILERSVAKVDDEVAIEIRRRMDHLEPGDGVLSTLISESAEHRSLDEDSLKDEVRTLLVAGHETTSRALTFAVFELLRNADVLARFRRDLPKGDEYLDCVIRETLRRHPIVPLVARRLAAPARIGNYQLSAGTVLGCSIHLLQLSERYWPEPLRFHPERFLGSKIASFEFLPFGQGRRRCLGKGFALLEMRTVLRKMMSDTRLRLVGPHLGRRGHPSFAAPTNVTVAREA